MNARDELKRFHTPLSREDVLARLRAQTGDFPKPSVFCLHEENYPEAVVEVQGDTFRIIRRRSFINPWSLTLEGAAAAESTDGTVLESRYRPHQFLPWRSRIYFISWLWVSVPIGFLAWNIFRTAHSHRFEIFSIVAIAAAQALFLWTTHRCEKRYKALATDEKDFLQSFIHEAIQADEMPTETSEPAGDDIAEVA